MLVIEKEKERGKVNDEVTFIACRDSINYFWIDDILPIC